MKIIVALVRLVEYTEDRERYSTEVGNVSPAGQTVPDDIVE